MSKGIDAVKEKVSDYTPPDFSELKGDADWIRK
jgi:hypothetical protein